MRLACDDAGPGNQGGLGAVAGIFVAHLPMGRLCLAVRVVEGADLDGAALPVQFGTDGLYRLACPSELGGFGHAPELVVGVLHVGLVAGGATSAADFEQARLFVDDGVGVGGGLAQAVGEAGLGRAGIGLGGVDELQVDLFDTGTGDGLTVLATLQRQTFDRKDAATLPVVRPGADALVDELTVAADAADGDAGEQGGVMRVFVMIEAADTAAGNAAVGVGEGFGVCLVVGGQADFDQVGEQVGFGECGALGGCAAVFVGEAADRAVDALYATEAVARFSQFTVEVVQMQFAPLRVGDFDQQALRVALQADEFAAGGKNLHEFAAAVEAEAAAVGPHPGVFVAVAGRTDEDAALAGVGAGADGRVAGAAAEDETGAVGLEDLDAGADGVEVGLVTEFPAASHDAVGGVGAGIGAVVVADDFEAEYAGQRGQVDLLLVFVAVGDVDGVAGALVGVTAVALAGDTAAAAGGAAGAGTAAAVGGSDGYSG